MTHITILLYIFILLWLPSVLGKKYTIAIFDWNEYKCKNKLTVIYELIYSAVFACHKPSSCCIYMKKFLISYDLTRDFDLPSMEEVDFSECKEKVTEIIMIDMECHEKARVLDLRVQASKRFFFKILYLQIQSPIARADTIRFDIQANQGNVDAIILFLHRLISNDFIFNYIINKAGSFQIIKEQNQLIEFRNFQSLTFWVEMKSYFMKEIHFLVQIKNYNRTSIRRVSCRYDYYLQNRNNFFRAFETTLRTGNILSMTTIYVKGPIQWFLFPQILLITIYFLFGTLFVSFIYIFFKRRHDKAFKNLSI